MTLNSKSFSLRTLRMSVYGVLVFAALCPMSSFTRAAELEVVESFWTSPARTTTPGADFTKVEVDRSDTYATLAVTLVNRSRQDITAIQASISLPTGVKQSSSIAEKPKSIHSGVVRFGDTFTLLFPLEFAKAFDNKSHRCPVSIEFHSVADTTSFTETVEAMLRKTGRTKLDVETVGNLQPGKTISVKAKVSNRGTAQAEALNLSFPIPPSNVNALPPAITISGQRSFEIPVLAPGQTVELNVSMYANPTAAGTLLALPARLDYTNALHQPATVSIPQAIGVFASSQQMLIDLLPVEKYLTAQPGMVSERSVQLVNLSDQDLANVLVAVTSRNESLKLLGQQRWLVERLPAGEKQLLKLTLYASKDLTERATSLNFSIQTEVDGQPQPVSENFNLGVYVDGTVNICVKDAAVTYIGGVPNLTGSLLNEGVGTARFSSLEILPSKGWKTQTSRPQYLGDVVEGSPQPFSFPLDATELPPEGETEVQFQLKYKNTLRDSLTTDLSAQVQHQIETPAQDEAPAPSFVELQSATIGWFVGGILLGLCFATLLALRRTSQLTRMLQEQKGKGRVSLDDALGAHSASGSK